MKLTPPAGAADQWYAADRRPGVEIRFVGRGPASSREGALAAVGGGGLELAWCRQVHSVRSLEAGPGDCGEGDALFTGRRGVALAIATADCVPVVVADRDRLAVIHAGWRGIAAGIVPRTLSRLGEPGPLTAWLGPAIGPCCYEVDADVAAAVVRASDATVETTAPNGRPHLDLHGAVVRQLSQAGIETVVRVTTCTRCNPDSLWSYRREGKGAGRNWAFAWLTVAAAAAEGAGRIDAH